MGAGPAPMSMLKHHTFGKFLFAPQIERRIDVYVETSCSRREDRSSAIAGCLRSNKLNGRVHDRRTTGRRCAVPCARACHVYCLEIQRCVLLWLRLETKSWPGNQNKKNTLMAWPEKQSCDSETCVHSTVQLPLALDKTTAHAGSTTKNKQAFRYIF